MKKKVGISLRLRIGAIAAFVLLVGSFVLLQNIRDRLAEKRSRQAFENITATSLDRIAELAVLEYRYTDVMELNRKFFLGGPSTSLVRFSGVIKAGIADTSRINTSYDTEAGRITVSLPGVELLDNTIDVSTVRIWDIKRNLFVPISTELKLQELTMFKQTIEDELLTTGFLLDAEERARHLIASLYAGFGVTVIVDEKVMIHE